MARTSSSCAEAAICFSLDDRRQRLRLLARPLDRRLRAARRRLQTLLPREQIAVRTLRGEGRPEKIEPPVGVPAAREGGTEEESLLLSLAMRPGCVWSQRLVPGRLHSAVTSPRRRRRGQRSA